MRERGKYERIFPLCEENMDEDLQHRYDYLIACSKEVYGEQTSLGAVNAKKKLDELDKKWNGPGGGGVSSTVTKTPASKPKFIPNSETKYREKIFT